MNPFNFFHGLLHGTEQLVSNVAQRVGQTVNNVTHPQQQQRPAPQPQKAPPKPQPRINLNTLKNAIANTHLQGIEQLTGHNVTVGSVAKGAADMVNQGVIQPINRGQQALYKLETGQPINTRQFVSDAATTGLNFATLGRGAAVKDAAVGLGTKVVRGLKEGAVLGGASGAAQTFANPNATVKDYARNIATGGVVGAAAGGAVPVVGAVAKGAVRAAKDAPQVLASEAGHVGLPGAAPDPRIPRAGLTYEEFKSAHKGDAAAMAKQLGVETPKVPNPDRRLRKVFNDVVAKLPPEPQPAAAKGAKAPTVEIQPSPEAAPMQSAGDIIAARGPKVKIAKTQALPQTPTPTTPPAGSKFQIPEESKVGGVPDMSSEGLPAGTAPSRFDRRIAADPRATPELSASLTEGGNHKILANEQTVTAARARIAANEDAAYGYATRTKGTEANATAMELLAKYLNNGEFEKADELTKAVSPRFTKTGQEMQILAAYSRLTPAGAVRYATQQLAKAGDGSRAGARAAAKTEAVQTELKAAQSAAAKQVGEEAAAKVKAATEGAGDATPADKLTPEERLAKRIKAGPSKPSEPDPITDMVNTLHKVAKQVLPEQAKKAQRSPMEFIGQAVREEGEFRRVYEAAKQIVAEKYKDNPAALEELDRYFGTEATRPYAQGQVNQAVQQGLKGVDVGALVRKHFSEVDATGEKLRDRLINEAGLTPEEATQLATDITDRFNQVATERKTAILNQMFGDHPTSQQKSVADRIIELSNLGGLSREDLHPLIADRFGVAQMTPKLAAEITQFAQAIQSLPEGSPERGRATAEMMQHIAKHVPTSTSDKVVGVWKAGLLTGLKTQTGNAAGNAANTAIKKIADAPAAAIDRAFSVFTKQRTKTFTLKGLGSGAKEGVGAGIKFFKTGVDERELTNFKLDTKQLNYKNPVINAYVNGVFRLMGASDRPAYYANLRNSMQDLAKAEALNQGLRGAERKQFIDNFIKDPPGEAVEAAVNAADKAVFANDTFLSDLASNLRRGASKYPGGAAAIQIIAPFTKVPSSVITQVFDYTPTGTIKEIIGQLLKGKFDQRAMSEAIGKSTVGTVGFISAGMALANAGLLTGAYPKEPKEQQAWKAEGKQPNSILIGGKWRSLNYLSPIGPLLGMGQTMAQASKDGGDALDQLAAAVAGGAKTALGQSFLQGVQGVLDAVNDPGRYGLNTLKNMASSVIPTLVGDAAKAGDPLQRQTNNVIDAVQAKIPGLRNSLPATTDAFGNDLSRPNSAAGTLLDPLRSSEARNSPLLQELDRLAAAKQGVYPVPDKAIQVGKETVKLTPAQANAYNKAVGQAVQKVWSEIIASPDYQALPDDKKKTALQGALDDIQAIQKVMTLRDPSVNKGELSDKIKLSARQVALASGKVLPADYITGAAGKPVDPKSKYQQDLAKYQNDKKAGRLSVSADLKAQDDLAREAVTSKYSQDVLDYYSLSNAEKRALAQSNPKESAKLYAEAYKLDQELVSQFGSTSKFAKGGGLRVAGARKGKKGPKARLPKLKAARVATAPRIKLARAKAQKSAGLKVASTKKVTLTA